MLDAAFPDIAVPIAIGTATSIEVASISTEPPDLPESSEPTRQSALVQGSLLDSKVDESPRASNVQRRSVTITAEPEAHALAEDDDEHLPSVQRDCTGLTLVGAIDSSTQWGRL